MTERPPTLPLDPGFTFVVQLAKAEARAADLQGLVEHVHSGRACRFGNVHEMKIFMEAQLRSVEAARARDGAQPSSPRSSPRR